MRRVARILALFLHWFSEHQFLQSITERASWQLYSSGLCYRRRALSLGNFFFIISKKFVATLLQNETFYYYLLDSKNVCLWKDRYYVQKQILPLISKDICNTNNFVKTAKDKGHSVPLLAKYRENGKRSLDNSFLNYIHSCFYITLASGEFYGDLSGQKRMGPNIEAQEGETKMQCWIQLWHRFQKTTSKTILINHQCLP